MCVSLSVCQFVCLYVFQSICLPVCLSVCVSVYLFASLSVCLSVSLPLSLSFSFTIFLPSYVSHSLIKFLLFYSITQTDGVFLKEADFSSFWYLSDILININATFIKDTESDKIQLLQILTINDTTDQKQIQRSPFRLSSQLRMAYFYLRKFIQSATRR